MSHAPCCDDPNFRPLPHGQWTERLAQLPPRLPLLLGALGRGLGRAVLRRHQLIQWRTRLLDSAVGARPDE